MANEDAPGLRYQAVDTPLGSVTVVAGPNGLTHVFLPGARPDHEGLDTTHAPHDPTLSERWTLLDLESGVQRLPPA